MSDTPERDPAAVEEDPTLEFAVDGERVAASRLTPADLDGPLPAVLWYTPYHKDDRTTHGRYDPILEYVAAHGYEVVVADMVGTGASTGRRETVFGPDMGTEAGTLVERIAERPWTTDRVGMIGKSFPGAVCLATAAEDPDPLAAIVPVLATHRRRRLAFDEGGLPYLSLLCGIAALFGVAHLQPPSRRPPGWERLWRDRLDRFREEGPPLARALEADPTDPYWDWTVPVETLDVPTFAVGGYRDHTPIDTVEYFAAIDAPKRLLVGPWRHVDPYKGRETAVEFRGQVVDWFDRFLKDEPVEPFEPTVAFWTERDGGRQVDAGRWRGRAMWPTADEAETLSFAATPDGLRRAERFDAGQLRRTHHVDHTVGLEAQDPSVGFVDTNADDARSTTVETRPLDRPVEVTGTGAATVHLTADASTQLSVRLVDVAPSGRARPITRGATRVDDPGEDPVAVTLRPVSHLVETGHRLRLALSAAHFPSHVPAGTAASFAVSSSPSAPTTVRIPGRDPAPETFEDTVSMAPPDDRFPTISSAVTGGGATYETSREHQQGTATLLNRATTEFAFPHVEKHYEVERETTVAHDDPETLSGRGTIRVTLHHEDDPVDVETTVHRDLDGATVEATVRRGGETVFEHEWST